jgi:nucleoside-diphosphate-sugar epimerase
MPRILITGSNSFIGNNFRIYSPNRDVKVISLRNTIIEQIDFSSIDVVLHLAAIVHVFKHIDKADYYRVNRDLTLNLAKAAKNAGVKQFVFLSTIKVYGEFKEGSSPWEENTACNPSDHYGKSKYEAELELQKLNAPDFTVSILRTPLVYGPGVMANMLKLIRLVEKVPVLPLARIDNTRPYIYIGNLVAYVDRIIELNIPGTFICMDEKMPSTSYLVEYLSQFLNKKVILFHLPQFCVKIGKRFYPGFFERLFGSVKLDNSITRDKLAFKPPFTTEEGLKQMVAGYLRS